MLRCDDFVFLQTSGQLDEMGRIKKVKTLTHVWVCHKCRQFRRNDLLLTQFVQQLKNQLLHSEQQRSID
jgi:hypothetical protein